MKSSKWIIIGIVSTIIIAGIFSVVSGASKKGVFAEYTADVYYSPECGCCINYMGYLRSKGMTVNPLLTTNIGQIKEKNNIPKNLYSCHTTNIGNYFVEGHVPVEAIKKLITENPQIDGISLPNMPSGSPGMPGKKTAPFEIIAIKDGKPLGIFATI